MTSEIRDNYFQSQIQQFKLLEPIYGTTVFYKVNGVPIIFLNEKIDTDKQVDLSGLDKFDIVLLSPIRTTNTLKIEARNLVVFTEVSAGKLDIAFARKLMVIGKPIVQTEPGDINLRHVGKNEENYFCVEKMGEDYSKFLTPLFLKIASHPFQQSASLDLASNLNSVIVEIGLLYSQCTKGGISGWGQENSFEFWGIPLLSLTTEQLATLEGNKKENNSNEKGDQKAGDATAKS